MLNFITHLINSLRQKPSGSPSPPGSFGSNDPGTIFPPAQSLGVPPGVPPGTYDEVLLGHRYDPRTGFMFNPSTGDWGHDLVQRPGDAENPWIKKIYPGYSPLPPDEKVGNFAKKWGKPVTLPPTPGS